MPAGYCCVYKHAAVIYKSATYANVLRSLKEVRECNFERRFDPVHVMGRLKFFQKAIDKLCLLYILYIYSKAERSGSVEIYIDNKSGTPIYDQIYTQIKNRILNGTMGEDAPLPSIRSLAKDLRISVITTKRAYDELEREGFIYTVAGKGCFVAPKNIELIREENLKKVEEYLMKASELAAVCGLRRQELIDMLEILLGEEEK